MRKDFLARKERRRKPGFNISLPGRLAIAVIGAVRDLKEHF